MYLPRALNMTNTRLAVVGPASVTNAFTSHLASFYPGLSQAVLRDCNCTGALSDQATDTAPPGFDGFNSATGSSSYVMPFASEDDLEAYTQQDDYGMNAGTPGVYAAVVFTQQGTAEGGWQWSYRLRANASAVFDTHTLRNDLARGMNLATISQYIYSNPFGGGDSSAYGSRPMPVYMPGFMMIQAAVDKFIMRMSLPGAPAPAVPFGAQVTDTLAFTATWGCINSTAAVCLAHGGEISSFLSSHGLFPQHATVIPFPTSEYRDNSFYSFVGQVFALVFVLSFFFPSFFLIRGLVVEKETKIREGVRMMVRRAMRHHDDEAGDGGGQWSAWPLSPLLLLLVLCADCRFLLLFLLLLTACCCRRAAVLWCCRAWATARCSRRGTSRTPSSSSSSRSRSPSQ